MDTELNGYIATHGDYTIMVQSAEGYTLEDGILVTSVSHHQDGTIDSHCDGMTLDNGIEWAINRMKEDIKGRLYQAKLDREESGEQLPIIGKGYTTAIFLHRGVGLMGEKFIGYIPTKKEYIIATIFDFNSYGWTKYFMDANSIIEHLEGQPHLQALIEATENEGVI